MQFAARMAQIRESGTARIARIAAQREASGLPVLRLNVGEPQFNTPEFIVEAAHRAIQEGQTRYTDVAGTPELRQAVADKFSKDNHIFSIREQTIVGTGAKQLIFNALIVSVEAGDEVIIPTPSWVSYPDMTYIAGGKPILVECGQNSGYKLTPQALKSVLNEQSRWIILNSPSNPTGVVYSSEELIQLADVIRSFPKVFVMSDDIYEKIIFDGRRFSTMAEIAPDLAHRILTINGVSKSFAMTGWRIGFATGPKELIAEMIKLQSQSTTNPSSVSQAAALAALTDKKHATEFLAKSLNTYQKRRDFVLDWINQIPYLQCEIPEGAFYAFVNCEKLIGRRTPTGSLLENDADLCEYLLNQKGVSVVPGAEFNGFGFFRISFATSNTTLESALNQIQLALDEL